MKKICFSIITMCLILCSTIIPSSAASVVSENSVDLVNVLTNNDPNVTIICHETTEDYIEAVENDPYLSQVEKDRMIDEAYQESMLRRGSYLYYTLQFDVKVTSTYHCYPYFYAKWYFPNESPSAIIEIKNANIKRDYNGISKQFSGQLYYNLETSRRLYWDLNGDFYNNGSTTTSGGVSIGVGEVASITFTCSSTSNHYKYIRYDEVYTF